MDLFKQSSFCQEPKAFYQLIKDKFFEVMNTAFCPVPSSREYYYYRNLITERPSVTADSDDEASVSHSDGVEFRSDKEINSSSEMPANFNENQTVSYRHLSVSPLFIHLVCTVRCNNEVVHTSVKLLPTCLGELLQNIEINSKSITASNLQLTLDILCLTLPLQVQNVLNDYSVKGMRTTSFCSDGFQPSVNSIITENSFSSEETPDPLHHLPQFQRTAIINLRNEIKWLLQDEIVAALLDTDMVTADTLNYVTKHVSDSVACSSSALDIIELHFVYSSNESYDKFEDEFSKMDIPNYKLQKAETFYFITKKTANIETLKIGEAVTEEQQLQGITSLFASTEVPVTNEAYDNILCRSEVFSQQSDISSINESFLGTDGGYDEDVSEDGENFVWLMQLEDRRKYLPNFWLIMKMNPKAVTIYFHCRFLELPTTHVGSYIQVQRTVKDAIRDLCKKVNQFMLLRSLHDTRVCDILLESDDYSWHNGSTTPMVNGSFPFSRLKSMDETSDECDAYSLAPAETCLKYTAGYFSCPVVWQAQFLLHPRLKSGPGKQGLSRGVHALKSVLDKFSVSNRNNMFVYKDVQSSVFYLRLFENFQSFNLKGLPVRSVEFENVVVSRSSSIISLPHKTCTLTESQHGMASSIDTDTRPRVRSFGEHESKDNPVEDMLILKVHGITEAGEDIRCGLIQVLQNRIDDAVLECLSVMLSRNALYPLTPEDVHFLQKPFRMPEIIIKLSIQDYALKYLESFVHYLHQNLLQFLNIPKYTDNKSHFHFKDYSETETNSNKFLDENIFIYNQSQNPSSGSKGIACIAVAIVSKNNNDNSFDGNFDALFKKCSFQEIVRVDRIYETDISKKTYLEFRLWKQGRDVFTDNLFQKLSSATSQALWDIVMEYYLLVPALCEKDVQRLSNSKCTLEHLTGSGWVEPVIYSSTEVKYNIYFNTGEIHQFASKETSKIFFTSCYKKKSVPLNSTARRCIQFSDGKEKAIVDVSKSQNIKLNSYELGQSGILNGMYVKILEQWLDFGVCLSAPTVKKFIINLPNRHTINVIVKELQNIVVHLSHDSISMFQILPLNHLSNEDIYVPYNSYSSSMKCLVIARNAEQWKACSMDNPADFRNAVIPINVKSFEKFLPIIIADNKLIPRQRIFWAIVTSHSLLVYTYNWSKDKVDKLVELLTNLESWLTIRSSFLNSVIAQKLGIFYNQPIARSSLLVSGNPFINYAGDVECMLKFPKDRGRRFLNSELNNQSVTILEVFRDLHQCIKVEHHDPVIVYSFETQKFKRNNKKHQDELRNLHSLWQSRRNTCTAAQIDILQHNSRIIHFCFTPLLFLPGWRIQSASTRDYSLIQNSTSNCNVYQKNKNSQEAEWHNSLCYHLITEFKCYLQNLGFIPIKIDNSARKFGFPVKEVPSCSSIFFVQKAMLGGILVFTINLNQPFLSTKLYVIECNRLHSTNSKTSINQFTLSFLDECDRIKTFMHLHSFTYDYHLRCVHNYISNKIFGGSNLCDGYHLVHFLDEYTKYYSKAPNFARNLVHQETVIVKDLTTEGKHLFDYLLSNVSQYGMDVSRMQDFDDGDTEYVIVQLSNTPQMSYTDAQDFRHTDDFDITLIITYLNSISYLHNHSLSVKYYLILTCRREIYPKDDIDNTLGKFRKVSSTYTAGLTKEKEEQEFYKNLLELLTETESECETNLTLSHESKRRGSNNDDLENSDLSRPISHVEIKQEFVNYLGYYSSHEQLMQQLILDRAAITRKKINDMVTQGMVDCRTHMLWNKFVSAQDINNLNYTEFIELKNLAQLEQLCQTHCNLALLLDQPVVWYQGLVKLLVTRYQDQHRTYISSDGNTQYYSFLHPRYDGAFMLLSIDLHTLRGDLHGAYRSSLTYKDSDIAVADRKSLLNSFINCICYYIWAGLI